jgi:hypothetical protein
VTLPDTLIRAIANAVEAEGGDMEDVHNLIGVWERLATDARGRVDRLRYEAAHPPRCRDGVPRER